MSLALLAAGSNGAGQLGIGTLEDAVSFADVSLPLPPCRIRRLAAGANHTLLLLDDGSLLIAGRDRSQTIEQLLSNHLRDKRTTFERADLSRFAGWQLVDIACVWETSLLVFRDALHRLKLFSLGSNDYGELGRVAIDNDEVAEVVLDQCRSLVRDMALATGPRHVVALYSRPCCHDHEALYAWGASRHGQLGAKLQDSSCIETPAQVEPFFQQHCWDAFPHAAVATQNATILLSQHGTDSCLTILNKAMPNGFRHVELPGEAYIQLRATWNLVLLVTSTGRLYQLEVSPTSQPVLIDLPLPVHQLACGSEHALAILRDDAQSELWAWGWNEHGNLGRGDRHDAKAWTRLQVRDKVVKVFAGNATSWLVVEREET